jgi:uncharacterized membrane protein
VLDMQQQYSTVCVAYISWVCWSRRVTSQIASQIWKSIVWYLFLPTKQLTNIFVCAYKKKNEREKKNSYFQVEFTKHNHLITMIRFHE